MPGATRWRNSAPSGRTAITLTLQASESTASAAQTKQGTTLAEEPLERIFERGVSDPRPPPLASERGHRSQGLLEAQTYVAQMGGTISATRRTGRLSRRTFSGWGKEGVSGTGGHAGGRSTDGRVRRCPTGRQKRGGYAAAIPFAPLAAHATGPADA